MSPAAPDIGLRPWGDGPDDADALTSAWSDPEVQKWTAVPTDRSITYAARWIAGAAERWEQRLAIDLVIVDPASPDVVHGEVGLVPVPGQVGWAEMGYWLLPAHRGCGRASTAVAMFTEMALDKEGFTRLFARTHVDNAGSGRVVERAGYQGLADPDGAMVLWTNDSRR